LAVKLSGSGELISLDTVDGRDAVAAARKLLQSRSKEGGISTWDASSIFFEMHGFEVGDKPSARTLVLLYAADLFFRLRWQIVPAIEEGKCVVAVSYLETGMAFGRVMGLPEKWLNEVFRFAPAPTESFRLNGALVAEMGEPTCGFVEFCSTALKEDLRPKFAGYFEDLERRGVCRSLP
jgi:hypothetical protein